MDISKGKITLKTVFIKYLLALCIVFAIILSIFAMIVSLCFRENILLSANYSEILAHQSKPIIEAATDITEDIIPFGCSYAVFDKEFNLIKTNLNNENLIEAKSYAKGNYTNNANVKSYFLIQRPDGVCVLQYYLTMRYGSEFLQKHFPSAQTMLIIMFIFLFIIAVFITSVFYAKGLNKRLEVLISTTTKIKDKDLDFVVKYSGIKEFDDVIVSLAEMKTELKISLRQQWNLEETKRNQISALTHDIKTPLTIIRGNAELLSDSDLNIEQQQYTNFINKNINQIEQYIKTLMEISNTSKILDVKLQNTNSMVFIENIKEQLEAFANIKELETDFIENKLPLEIYIDKGLLYRAIMNVISNAVDYSPHNGKIYFEVKSLNNNISFTITDSGKGFSEEDIKSASTQFYMSDNSRISKTHYGMGLYITETIVKMHNGALTLTNSSITGGAQVIIKIPI